MVAGKIHHWKHGWIPLDDYARGILAKREEDQKPKPLDISPYDQLSPSLQGKINTKLESLTGIPEPELAKRVQANLISLYENSDKSQGDWYKNEGVDIAKRAQRVSEEFPGSNLTQEKLTGMVAVTSAHKRWAENKDFAEAIARKMAADKQFNVSQAMIDDYNGFVGKRKTHGELKLHPELKPGLHRPSDLPADFAASKVPGMPRHLNTDYVVRAVQIYKGDSSLDEVVSGPKQRSFVDNLMDPDNPRFVTIDTWQYKASMGDIPVTREIGGKKFTHTVDDWSDRQVAVDDGRAAISGYNPELDRFDAKNVKATIKAVRESQELFQAGPSSVADKWKGTYGTYPWFVKQTQVAAKRLGVSPVALQAIAWYAVGGGA